MLKQLHQQRGINMVELLVTIIITSVGLLGLNSLQLKASRSTQDSGNRSQAVWMLDDLTNRMRANLVGFDSYATTGEVNCNNFASAPKVCSSYHNGSAKVPAPTNCTAAEQAKSDLYLVLCGAGASVSGSDVTFAGSASFIAEPSIEISIDANKVADITLSWNARTSGQDGAGNTVYAIGDNSDNSIDMRASVTAKVHP